MTDFAMDFVIARMDDEIGEQRAGLRYYVRLHGRHHNESIRAHEAIRVLRIFRSELIRSSGWKPRLAA